MREETWLRDLVAAPLVNGCPQCDAEARRWARLMGIDEDLVAWWAHVGGFSAGVALGRTMWVRKPTRSRLRI